MSLCQPRRSCFWQIVILFWAINLSSTSFFQIFEKKPPALAQEQSPVSLWRTRRFKTMVLFCTAVPFARTMLLVTLCVALLAGIAQAQEQGNNGNNGNNNNGEPGKSTVKTTTVITGPPTTKATVKTTEPPRISTTSRPTPMPRSTLNYNELFTKRKGEVDPTGSPSKFCRVFLPLLWKRCEVCEVVLEQSDETFALPPPGTCHPSPMSSHKSRRYPWGNVTTPLTCAQLWLVTPLVCYPPLTCHPSSSLLWPPMDVNGSPLTCHPPDLSSTSDMSPSLNCQPPRFARQLWQRGILHVPWPFWPISMQFKVWLATDTGDNLRSCMVANWPHQTRFGAFAAPTWCISAICKPTKSFEQKKIKKYQKIKNNRKIRKS